MIRSSLRFVRLCNSQFARRFSSSESSTNTTTTASTATSKDPLDFRGHYAKPIMVLRKGLDLLRDPVTNSTFSIITFLVCLLLILEGTAFPVAERDALGLRGLLPPVVKTLEVFLSVFDHQTGLLFTNSCSNK